MINILRQKKGLLNIAFSTLILGSLSFAMVFKLLQENQSEKYAEKDINYIIKYHNYKLFWDNLSQSERKKFINYQTFKTFVKNKYGNLKIEISNLTLTSQNNIYVQFKFIQNKEERIPQYFSSHRFVFKLNKNDKLESVGIFSINTPIIIYYKNYPPQKMNLPILMLHRVAPSYPPRSNYSSEYGYKLDYSLTLTTSVFEQELEYLKTHDYTPITLNRLYTYYYYGFPLPKKPIIITFDDGRESQFLYAFPILKKFHDVADFNIITGFVGSKISKSHKYMTWKQIKILYENGMEIESHTVTHLALGTLPVNLINYQIQISKQTLQKKLQNSVQFIAYPSGSPFRNNNIAKENILIQRLKYFGYVGGVLDDRKIIINQNLQNPFILYRLRDSNINLQGFIDLIHGNII